MRTYWHIVFLAVFGLVALMIPAEQALSNGLYGDDTTYVVTYEEGDTERIPAATASISLLECSDTYKGAFFTFEVDVFASSWRPVYAIEILGIDGTTVEAVKWPPGWYATAFPHVLDSAIGALSFSTDSNPIVPGARLNGFTVLSNSNTAVIRWYPADKTGMLLGKVTRTELQCPSATVPGTWGTIKAVYR